MTAAPTESVKDLAMSEAFRRNILPADKDAAYREGLNRGIVKYIPSEEEMSDFVSVHAGKGVRSVSSENLFVDQTSRMQPINPNAKIKWPTPVVVAIQHGKTVIRDIDDFGNALAGAVVDAGESLLTGGQKATQYLWSRVIGGDVAWEYQKGMADESHEVARRWIDENFPPPQTTVGKFMRGLGKECIEAAAVMEILPVPAVAGRLGEFVRSKSTALWPWAQKALAGLTETTISLSGWLAAASAPEAAQQPNLTEAAKVIAQEASRPIVNSFKFVLNAAKGKTPPAEQWIDVAFLIAGTSVSVLKRTDAEKFAIRNEQTFAALGHDIPPAKRDAVHDALKSVDGDPVAKNRIERALLRGEKIADDEFAAKATQAETTGESTASRGFQIESAQKPATTAVERPTGAPKAKAPRNASETPMAPAAATGVSKPSEEVQRAEGKVTETGGPAVEQKKPAIAPAEVEAPQRTPQRQGEGAEVEGVGQPAALAEEVKPQAQRQERISGVEGGTKFKESLEDKFDRFSREASERIRTRQPRGKTRAKGESTVGRDLSDLAIIAAARSAKLGIRTGKALVRHVKQVIEELAPHLSDHWGLVTNRVRKILKASYLGSEGPGIKFDPDAFEQAAAQLIERYYGETTQTVKQTIRQSTRAGTRGKVVQTMREALGRTIRLREKGRRSGLREAVTIRKQLLSAAKDDLPLAVRGKVLSAMANLKGIEGLDAALVKVQSVLDEYVTKSAQRRLKKILSALKPDSMRPEYRDRMKPLIAQLDKAKLSSGKRARLEALADYIERNPDNFIPPADIAQLTRLTKTPIPEMTTEQANTFSDQLLALATRNELKNKLIFGRRAKSLQQAKRTVLSEVEAHHSEMGFTKGKWLAERQNDTSTLGQLWDDTAAPENLAVSAGGMDGTFHKITVLDIIDAQEAQYASADVGQKTIYDVLLKHGMLPRDAVRPIANNISLRKYLSWSKRTRRLDLPDAKVVRFTGPELLNAVLLSRIPDTRLLVIQNGVISRRFAGIASRVVKLSDRDLREIEKSLTPVERELAGAIAGYLDGPLRESINAASVVHEGRAIAIRDHYFPRTPDRAQMQKNIGDIRNVFSRKWLEQQGFLKPTVEHKIPFVLDNALNVFFSHIQVATAYAHMSVPIRNALMVLGNPEVAESLRSRMGSKFIPLMESYLEDVSGASGVYLNTWERLTRTLARNAAVAKLAWRISTIWNNFAGAPTVLATQMSRVQKLKYIKYIPNVRRNAGSYFDKNIAPHSPFLKRRYGRDPYRLLVYASASDVSGLPKGQLSYYWRTLQDGSLQPISKAERYGVVAAWRMLMDEAKVNNKSASESELASSVAKKLGLWVRRTQNPTTEAEMSAVGRQSRKNPLLGIILMFTSQPAKQRDVLSLSFMAGKRSKLWGPFISTAVLSLLAGAAVPGVGRHIMAWIRRGGREEEKYSDWVKRKTALDYSIDALANTLDITVHPVVADAVRVIRNKVKYGQMYGGTVVGSAVEDLLKLVDIVKLEFKSGMSENEQEKAAERIHNLTFDVIRGLALITGAPLDAPVEYVEGALKALEPRMTRSEIQAELDKVSYADTAMNRKLGRVGLPKSGKDKQWQFYRNRLAEHE